MFKSNLAEVAEARRAINCLQLEVPVSIALDISKKVEAAFDAISSQQGQSSRPDSRCICEPYYANQGIHSTACPLYKSGRR